MEPDWPEIALKTIQDRLSEAVAELDSLRQSLGSEAKSTAGDKHETGRAMIQLDMERAAAKLRELQTASANALQLFRTSPATDQVRLGHTVETNNGCFLLGPPLGKLTCDDGTACFALSAASPLGQRLLGKQVGESFQSGPQVFKILSIHAPLVP